MSAPEGWGLPRTALLDGRRYGLNTDYRDILDIIGWLEGEKGAAFSPEERWYIALHLFYREFEEMPADSYAAATAYLAEFLAGGRREESRPGPRLLDWDQDAPLIVSGINKAAGCEVRALPYLHWWTFLAWFAGIGEGTLSTVVAIRDKLRRGKRLEPWELEFYRTHRAEVELRPRMSDAEKAERARLRALLDGSGPKKGGTALDKHPV